MTHKILVFKTENGDLAETTGTQEELQSLINSHRLFPQGHPWKIINAEDLPSDQSTRNAWYLDPQDLLVKVDQQKLDDLKPIASGKDFIDFCRQKIQEENNNNNFTIEQSAENFKLIENSFKSWSRMQGDPNPLNLWETLEGRLKLRQSDWTEIKSLIQNSQQFNGNNAQGIADKILGLGAIWETTVKFPTEA